MAVYPRDLEAGQRIVAKLKPCEWAWVGKSAIKFGDDGKWYVDPKTPLHITSSDTALDGSWRFQVCKRHPGRWWIFPDPNKPCAYYCLIPQLPNNNPIWESQPVQKGWVPVRLLERKPMIDRFSNLSWWNVAFLAAGIVGGIDAGFGGPLKNQLEVVLEVLGGGTPFLVRMAPMAVQFAEMQIMNAETIIGDDTGGAIDDATAQQLQEQAPQVSGPSQQLPANPEPNRVIQPFRPRDARTKFSGDHTELT